MATAVNKSINDHVRVKFAFGEPNASLHVQQPILTHLVSLRGAVTMLRAAMHAAVQAVSVGGNLEIDRRRLPIDGRLVVKPVGPGAIHTS